MLIQCDKCGVQLDLTGYQGRTDVLTVKCTQCGHLIRGVDMSQSGTTQDFSSSSWRIRRSNGELLSFDGLRMLKQWVAEGRVNPTDEVSADGQNWRPLQDLMDDPELGLAKKPSAGPPPLPATAFSVPDNTLDAPDPEEEFEDRAPPLDDEIDLGSAMGLQSRNAPINRPLRAPVVASSAPLSTSTGFSPLPSSAPDKPARPGLSLSPDDGPSDEAETLNLRTLDEQPTLQYRPVSEAPATSVPINIADSSATIPVMDEPQDPDDEDLPSLAEAVEHLVTSDNLQPVDLHNLSFSDEASESAENKGLEIKRGGQMGSFFAGLLVAAIIGVGAFIYAKSDKTAHRSAPAVSTQTSAVKPDQLVEFADAVRDAQGGDVESRARALRTFERLLKLNGDQSNSSRFTATVFLEKSRVLKEMALAEREGSDAFVKLLARSRDALDKARKLKGEEGFGDLLQVELLHLEGNGEEARQTLSAAKARGIGGSEVARLDRLLAPSTVSDAAKSKSTSGSNEAKREEAAKKKPSGQSADASETTAEKQPSAPTTSDDTRAVPKDGATKPTSRTKRSPQAQFGKIMKSGYSLLERGKVAQARAAFTEAAELRPNDPEPHANLGWCALESRSYDQAISFFQKSLAVRSKFSDALFGLGVVYQKQGRRQLAIKAFEDYLRAHPRGSKARMIKNRLETLRP